MLVAGNGARAAEDGSEDPLQRLDLVFGGDQGGERAQVECTAGSGTGDSDGAGEPFTPARVGGPPRGTRPETTPAVTRYTASASQFAPSRR